MDVASGTAAPAFAAGCELKLDDPLSAEIDGDLPVEILRGVRHENAAAFLESRHHFRLMDDLRKMRRADLLFAFGYEYQIDGELAARSSDCVKRREECGFGTFLINGPAPDHYFAEAGLVDKRSGPWRRRPFGGIGLLHVIDEVQSEGSRSARVELREYTRLAVSRDPSHFGESRLAEESHGEIAAFAHSAVFGGDRRLFDPFLEPLYGFAVTFLYLGANSAQIGVICPRAARQRKGGRSGRGASKEVSPLHQVLLFVLIFECAEVSIPRLLQSIPLNYSPRSSNRIRRSACLQQ